MSNAIDVPARWRAPLALALIITVATPLALRSETATGAEQMHTVGGVPVDAAISRIWRADDEPVANGSAVRGWLWGPHAIATGVEYSEDSPALRRTMVYFDKARLDILDPSTSPDSAWHVTGALLVAQMLAGEIPFGPDTVAARDSPHIPIAGDPDQPGALTYAALGPRASIDGKALRGGDSVPVPASRVGQEVGDLIRGNGQIEYAAIAGHGVTYGSYDDVTGHNIAKPFAEWIVAQQYPANYIIGRPLTEPYWVDATVGGVAQRVMVQAFERRVLTYTPDNDPAWRVESGNAGLHYRTWRGLSQPSDPTLVSLASLEPFGEEIVGAATRHGVDPFLLAAIAQAASHGNPGATQATGGVGLLAVQADEYARQTEAFHDPARNADHAAGELRRWNGASADRAAILANYYSGGNPDWGDPALTGLIDATLNAYASLKATHPIAYTPTTPAPPAEPDVPASGPGAFLGTGAAAYYSQSYDVAWWERTMRLYDSWGTAVAGWQYDPNGYYCVHPGYRVGQRLHLSANGVTITCTIGDAVATQHVSGWHAKWVVELNWPAFKALGLDTRNAVTVHEAGQ
ncbi:MAG TPA: transglycosylase SLT domain-containing protein [Thermomicrobiales bacterium]|nr:transglycosylase SLT domain-containing protein [Thermomicrobiales bacterium]